MKKFIFVPMVVAALVVLTTQCLNKKQAAPSQKAITLQTHKDGADSMRIDSAAPLKPLIFQALNNVQAMAVLTENNIDSLFLTDTPDNGFYGEDRYRIEFINQSVKRDPKDVTLYHIKGMNRHKKHITPFVGTIRIKQISEFTDPNVSMDSYDNSPNAKYSHMYAAKGDFVIAEDSTVQYSGLFKGEMKIEFIAMPKESPSLWFYSQAGLPSGCAGYRFDGTWTNYSKKDMVKPVIWARDIFRFSNDILKDFSYGERDIEINPKYRDLGWEDYWANDEWWNKAEKPKM